MYCWDEGNFPFSSKMDFSCLIDVSPRNVALNGGCPSNIEQSSMINHLLLLDRKAHRVGVEGWEVNL